MPCRNGAAAVAAGIAQAIDPGAAFRKFTSGYGHHVVIAGIRIDCAAFAGS